MTKDKITYNPKYIRLARYARALGHPARIKILLHLKKQDDCCAGELLINMPLAQSTVSQHLKVLTTSGLIRGTTEPPRVRYCVNEDVYNEAKTLFHLLP